MTTYEILSDGIAAVAAEPADNQLPVHGVLFGPGDITQGLTGKRTRWPADILEKMADDGIFEGKPFTLADSLDPEQHAGVEMTESGPALTGAVSMDEKVGEITATKFDEDAGLLFDGFLADWEAEETVESGLAQISPVVIRDVELVEGEEGEPDAIYEPTRVEVARDVALVADGAVPSNEINVGQSPAIEPAAAEALSAHYGVDVEALTEDYPEGDDGHTTPSGQTNGSDSRGQSTPANDDTIIMDLTDKEQELVAAARQKDDPTVVEAEVRDRLTELEEQADEHEELIEEAADLDEPEVMDAEEAEAMRERVDIVEGMMAEALTEDLGLREATVEAMSFDAMASEFKTDDGDLDVEALTQSPEAGSGPTGGSGGSSGPTDEDKQRIEEIDTKLSAVGNALPDERVEALRDEAASLAGADDYDGALEVL
ncbi:hypothetical protein [Halostagnicola kamekurae]|uniref:Prohead serine protease n=1 Tax=Halostagnicola kamekurae TaxID=619731 RepID=A0A1I6REL4_9EURY|nr:hypothetical protein [Halostagnicola kamekurae]SFS62928.1 hypothetical protein SAMN04488556_1729 [Halostagnicola kamekurae]